LRTIGRPDELRDQLLAMTLSVRTLSPPPDPGRVFAGLAAVDGWHVDGPAGYVLSVSEPAVAAPAVTRALVAAGIAWSTARNASIVWAMGVIPCIFLIQPLIQVFALPASASGQIRHENALLYLAPTTPVRREEFLLGKALAWLAPSVLVAYAVYAVFLPTVVVTSLIAFNVIHASLGLALGAAAALLLDGGGRPAPCACRPPSPASAAISG
jgi:hypothetical protein